MALPDPIAQAIGARTAALIAVLARAAFDRFWQDVQAGTPPQEAIQKAQAGFAGAFADQLAAAFGEILQQSIGVADVRDMPVGDVTLSRKLHRHNIQTEQEVTGIIRRHAQGVLQARELSISLYDGYNPQDGIQRPLEGAARAKLPKYLRWLTEDKPTRDGLTALQVQGQEQAARLKSLALRAGYLEAIEAWKRGAATEALQRRLQVAQREKNRFFANRIAQTELARAHQSRVAAEFLSDETIDAVQVVLNPAHPRTDICDLHARADLYGLGPGVYPKKVAPRPPYHPFCLTGDARITASGRILGVTKRWFNGDVVIIATASGQRLTATVNHPILTPGGWVGAGLLNVGDKVIVRPAGVSVRGNALDVDHHQNVPPSIAEIADAFLRSRHVETREVPGSTEDFHGDGVAGQVTVIGADCKLWDGVDAGGAQFAHHSLLERANSGERSLPCDGSLDEPLEVLGNPPDGVVRGSDHSRTSSNAQPLQSDAVLLGLRPLLHAGIAQPDTDDVARDAELARQIQNGATGQVFADDVISIKRQAFSGHVFNLETDQGHYTSNNIVTHNCWCVLRSKTSLFGVASRPVPNGPQAFLRSLSDDEAARVMGSRGKRDAVLRGTSPEDVINAGQDPAYRLVRLGDPRATESPVKVQQRDEGP